MPVPGVIEGSRELIGLLGREAGSAARPRGGL
jgi:hypothetical protein